jgi:RNA polymerase sigma-70 factor (ECF subfamily)
MAMSMKPLNKPMWDRRQWVLDALDQFEGKLLRYAQRLLGGGDVLRSSDEARDVVQFVFLRLCDQSPESIGDRLAQWLYTVCRNRALDVLRSSGREQSNEWVAVGRKADPRRGCPDGEPGLPFGHPQPPSREVDPAETAEQGELHDLLRLLIEVLPANQREAIDLWADGFNYRQIASIIDCQEGHVRVLVHRGLKALREHPQVRAIMEEDREEEGREEEGRASAPIATEKKIARTESAKTLARNANEKTLARSASEGR